MNYNSSKKGLETVFEPWQIEALKQLFTYDHEDYVSNSQIHKKLKEANVHISKASIINFFASIAEEGLIKKRTEVGKGGVKSLYAWRWSNEALAEVIGQRLIDSILRELTESE